ncbi:hypothetical protein PVL29_018782 [Vitis rotundifolia]|uniref:Peptidase S54 rhomboid domain-containing protein n=1 Tax=Vitis rotundifolia TaxID=103349 RepID=A0AA38Z623_VITRO|nr:hypothetical protein PVL29_018782 [Vitis rotundifolia]
MAVVPVCHKMSYKDRAYPIQKIIRQSEKGFSWDCIGIQEGSGCFSSMCSDSTGISIKLKARVHNRSLLQFRHRTELHGLHRMSYTESCLRSISENASQKENLGTVWSASESSTNEKQLRLLDSYFGKLHNEDDGSSLHSSDKKTELMVQSGQFKPKEGPGSLEDYLGKINKDATSENYLPSSPCDKIDEDKHDIEPFSTTEDVNPVDEGKLKSYAELRNKDGDSGPKNSRGQQPYDETSDLYLISILVSINIAVVLFELASPIRNSDLELSSLPLIYGAKINDLILVGEWWRLVTPMFLHSGIFHVALGCWVLLTFGPQVCRGYGSFTFFLIYILGGISGNLTSFLHTPDLTVGGTGPVFAIIGAWVIHQIQNKDVIAKDVSESMYQKAIIATALSSILSHFCPIDDWTHFGAAFTGIAYGYFTCPMLQLNDASSKTGQKEGITLVRRYADPCKSLIIFTLFILVLICVLFFIEPSLNTLVSSSFE